MKQKYFIFLLLLMVMQSCVTDDASPITPNDDFGVEEQFNNVPISLRQAVSNADFIYRDIDGDRPRTRRISDVRLLTSSDLSGGNAMTRSSSDEEALAYVVNYENNDGYAILAANEQLPPVIMIGDEGNFSTDAFIEFVNNSSTTRSTDEQETPEELQYALINNSLIAQYPSVPVGSKTDTTILLKCLPLVKTKWGQNAPYNMYAIENGVVCMAGCVPLAASQTLAALCYRHNFRPSVEIHEDYTVDWKTINRQLFQDSIRYTHETPGARAAATLIRATGVAMGATYTPDSTSASSSRIATMFKRIGMQYAEYLSNTTVTDDSIFEMIINRNYPVPCSARRLKSNNTTTGHAFVLDGWLRLQYTTIMLGASTIGGPPAENDYVQDTFDLVHVNFGWGGSSDGYYLLNAFDISSDEFDDYSEENDNPNNWDRNYNLNINYTMYNL